MKSENFSLDGFLDDKPKKVIRKKKCTKCREWKSINEFYERKNSEYADGYTTICKECEKKRSIKAYNGYKMRNKNRDPYNNTKKKCSICKKWKVRSKENWRKNSGTSDGLRYLCKECEKIKRVELNYNITKKEYNYMLKEQEYICKICKGDLGNKPCIDHNHRNGEIRGILCDNCNKGLGLFRDNPFILFRAIKYLKGELE